MTFIHFQNDRFHDSISVHKKAVDRFAGGFFPYEATLSGPYRLFRSYARLSWDQRSCYSLCCGIDETQDRSWRVESTNN